MSKKMKNVTRLNKVGVAVCAVILGVTLLALPKVSRAEAWSSGALGCTVQVYNGVLPYATMWSDLPGAYITFGSSAPSIYTVNVACPVWLPNGTWVNRIRIRVYDNWSDLNQYVTATFYSQPQTTGDYATLGTVKSGNSPDVAAYSAALTSAVQINNDANVYYVVVQLKRTQSNVLLRFYSVQLYYGTSVSGESAPEPIDLLPSGNSQ